MIQLTVAMNGIRHVVCGLSGGVDSAVAALLLKQKGYRVTGVFMKNWDITNEVGHCSADADCEDARYVSRHLKIPFVEVNFVKNYWNEVFTKMIQEYEKGTTPNPDVLCNKYVKFGCFFNYATNTLGADAVATGHYARNSFGNFLEKVPRSCAEGAKLLKSIDSLKDQTLFLSQMPQHALQRTMFPVGDLTKDVVKKIALSAGLAKIVKKKESMGICFIGSRNFATFIEEYIEPKPGEFIDIESGSVVGRHKGTHYWTIGQRAMLAGLSKAYFVAKVCPKSQIILVAKGTDHPALFSRNMITEKPCWIHKTPPEILSSAVYKCDFRFQHIHPVIKCEVSVNKANGLDVVLKEPLRALTPGQYAVFYRGEECLGSAQILKVGPSLFEQNVSDPTRNYNECTEIA